jgi:hypothetical protein
MNLIPAREPEQKNERLRQASELPARCRKDARAEADSSREHFMLRTIVCAALALGIFALTGTAEDKAQKAQKNQMVKGTIKSVNVKDLVLVVNQKVKKETVERQLDIKETTEFIITIGQEKKELSGRLGLELLEGKEGAQISVKCDKDVNVLQVKVMLKK